MKYKLYTQVKVQRTCSCVNT